MYEFDKPAGAVEYEKEPAGKNNLLHLKPRKVKMLLALQKNLGKVMPAAKEAGIDRATHYRWLKTDLKYKTAFDTQNKVTLNFTEAKLLNYLQENELNNAMFLLKMRGRSRSY